MTAFVEVPGIRVVRPLARDERLESLLVQIDGETGPRAAVLARARDEGGARMRRIELAAMDRARGPGVAEVIDVVADQFAPAIVLARPAGRPLAELIAERTRWRAGEVVGILEPLVAIVDRLHAAGVAHGELGASRIVLSENGPQLLDFTRAELFAASASAAVLDGVDGVARDRDAVRALAGELLSRVDGARSAAAADLAVRTATVSSTALLAELAEGLRGLAAAVPVRDESDVDAETALMVAGESAQHVPLAPEAEPPSRGVLPRLRDAVPRLRALLDALPTARRRVILGGGAAVVFAAVALALVPGSSVEHEAAEIAVSSGAPSPGASEGAAVTADDPLAALLLLLERREGCMRELSLLCLEGVDQPGSSALADDRAELQTVRDGGEAAIRQVGTGDPRIVERLGDSVLIETGPETAPASILLMRTEAGWRIRDWIAEERDSPS